MGTKRLVGHGARSLPAWYLSIFSNHPDNDSSFDSQDRITMKQPNEARLICWERFFVVEKIFSQTRFPIKEGGELFLFSKNWDQTKSVVTRFSLNARPP